MMSMTPNASFRYRARTALKNNWQIALLVVFIASLPSILTQVVGVLTGGDMTTRLNALLEDPAFLSGSTDVMLGKLVDAMNVVSSPMYAAVSLASLILAPALTAGMQAYMMGLLKNQPGEISSVFCRLKYFLKALGLNLLVGLKTCLWAVPGMAIAIGGTAVAFGVSSNGDAAVSLMMVFMIVGYVLMFWLMIAAILRYAMAPYAFAQEPQTGVVACVNRSKEIMKGRKGQLFGLELSFIGWSLLVMLVYSTLLGMIGTVAALTVQMFLNLILYAYQYCAFSAFYLEYSEKGTQQIDNMNPIRPITTDFDPDKASKEGPDTLVGMDAIKTTEENDPYHQGPMGE